MKLPIILSLLYTLSSTIPVRPDPDGSPIRLPTDPLNSRGYTYNCMSWRLAAEVNNARNWKVVPAECVDYIGNYMTSTQNGVEPQWHADLKMAVAQALEYLSTVMPTPNKKDAWIFGLADTLISSLPYYNRTDVRFGGVEADEAKYNEFIVEGEMPAVPYVLDLYWAAKDKGFKVIILSGLTEEFRPIMESKLRKAGIDAWDKLLFKDKASTPQKDYRAHTTALLKKEGYKLIGNVGDQWVDLLTSNGGKRLFKLPNPLYYDSS